MSWSLIDVGLAEGDEVLAQGVHWSLAASGLYQVPPSAGAQAMARVLARERLGDLRVWGRITESRLDWRIRPPAVRVKERQRVGGQGVLEALGAALPAEVTVDVLAGNPSVLHERADLQLQRLGLDVPLSSTVAELEVVQRVALELLRAALAEPSLVWVDVAAPEAALRILAHDCAVVVVGTLEGAEPLELPLGDGRSPPEPPRWLRWVVDRQLGGMRRPGAMGDVDADVARLRQLGVTRVIGLEEAPMAAEALRGVGIDYRHFPIVDMEAPALDATRALVREALTRVEDGERLVFHCKAGLGRTGTLLCACLIEAGYGMHQALTLLRQFRAEYVQSDAQLRFLQRYEAAR